MVCISLEHSLVEHGMFEAISEHFSSSQQIGVVSLDEAIQRAEDAELDLV